MRTVVSGGHIINEGKTLAATIVIDDGRIADIIPATTSPTPPSADELIDATGCYVLPGIIDDHVHFREPGLTQKADIDSESRAAAAGGVTSYFDMPNCVPQTTTPEALDDKRRTAAAKSHVNYAFFYGATNDNADTFARLDATRIPGIKLFMGSSTGGMLVDRQAPLERVFQACGRLPLMVTHQCPIGNFIGGKQNRMYCSRRGHTERYMLRCGKVSFLLRPDCENCICTILTAEPLDIRGDMLSFKVGRVRLNFMDENAETTERIIRSCEAILSGRSRIPAAPSIYDKSVL